MRYKFVLKSKKVGYKTDIKSKDEDSFCMLMTNLTATLIRLTLENFTASKKDFLDMLSQAYDDIKKDMKNKEEK